MASRKYIVILLLFLSLGALAACAAREATPAPVVGKVQAPGEPTPADVAMTVEEWREILHDDDAARLEAIQALKEEGSPEAVAALGDFLLTSNKPGRSDAARALIDLDTEQARGYLRAAMADTSLTARRQIVMQALERRGEAALPILSAFARDQDELVRLHAIQVLEFIASPTTRRVLMSALHDPSPQVQDAAARALYSIGFVPPPTAAPSEP